MDRLAVEDMPGNCGISVICDFPEPEMNFPAKRCLIRRSTITSINKEVREIIKSHKEVHGGYEPASLLLASLNIHQRKDIEPILIKNKFRKIGSAWNINSKNNIFLYSLEIRSERL